MGGQQWLGSILSGRKGREGLVGRSKRRACHLSGENHAGKPAIAGNTKALLLPQGSAAENLQHRPFEQPGLADRIPPPMQSETGGKWLGGAAHPGDLLIA